MTIRTGSGGLNFLGRDVDRSDTRLGRITQRLGKAKSTGAGIGGLLGGIIGQILIPIPGVGAAIGAGLGSLAGSKIGGATSGVNQGDILNSKFRKDSALNLAKQIAQSEFADVAKSTVSGFMQGINPSSSLSKFDKGFEAGGVTGGFESLFAKVPSVASGAEEGLPGLQGGPAFGGEGIPGLSEGPILKAGDVMGDATNTAVPGLNTSDSLLGRISKSKSYTSADKFLGGILPGGEQLSAGSLGGSLGGLPGKVAQGVGSKFGGLLGPKVDNTNEYNFEGYKGGESSEDVFKFQQMFNQSGLGTISEDGTWGPQTSSAYDQWVGSQ